MLRSEGGVDGEVGHTDKLFNKDIWITSDTGDRVRWMDSR